MPVSHDESHLFTSLMCLQLSTVMHASLPVGELSYRKTPNNSQGVYVFQSRMKMSQTAPASLWILWHAPASEVIAKEETIQPTSTRCKLLMSAVTHCGVHLFLHRPDHFAGHSLVACPFADNSSPHVYLRLLASLLPPSTRQPGPVAVLLGQMLKLCLIFRQFLTLLGSTEKRLGAVE